MSRLLVRDLARVVTLGGQGPLRGDAMRQVNVLDDAFVLCVDGTIEQIGHMRHLGHVGEVEELDGRGLTALPGLVDCHTHPAFGGDRVEDFTLRAAGATYEELHAAGGGILSRR